MILGENIKLAVTSCEDINDLNEYLEILQHSKLLLPAVQFKGNSKKSLNAVEPEAVTCSCYLQPMKPESCNKPAEAQHDLVWVPVFMRIDVSYMKSVMSMVLFFLT